MRLVIIVELDGCARAKVQRDVGPTGHCVQAVVLVPIIVEGGLIFLVAGGHRPGSLPDIVIGIIDQMRGSAGRIPVTGAAQLRIESDPAIVTLVGLGVWLAKALVDNGRAITLKGKRPTISETIVNQTNRVYLRMVCFTSQKGWILMVH